MSMSSLNFPTKDMNVLIIAVFSIAISLGLSQVSTVLAVESQDTAEEVTAEKDDTKNELESIVNTGSPAVASPDDNIIKPINLNKGSDTDEPLPTNKEKQQDLEKIVNNKDVSNNINNNNLNQNQGMDLDKYSSMSELYQSFDLPYTALYKNPN